MTKLIPIPGRFILDREDPKICSDNGIIFSKKEREGSRLGKVLSLPTEYKGPVKVDDTVIFTEYAGRYVVWEDEKVYIVDEKLVLGITYGN